MHALREFNPIPSVTSELYYSQTGSQTNTHAHTHTYIHTYSRHPITFSFVRDYRVTDPCVVVCISSQSMWTTVYVHHNNERPLHGLARNLPVDVYIRQHACSYNVCKWMSANCVCRRNVVVCTRIRDRCLIHNIQYTRILRDSKMNSAIICRYSVLQ